MEKLEWLSAVNPSTGTAYGVNASMVFRPLKVYKFTAKLVKPKKQLMYCHCCFAKFVLGQVGTRTRLFQYLFVVFGSVTACASFWGTALY